MALKDCTGQVGRRLVIRSLPPVRQADDVVFVPPGAASAWGLFEPSGRAVSESLHYTGVGTLHDVVGSRSIDVIPASEPQPDAFDYIFMGHVIPHYGHFLIGPFSRLWALPNYARTKVRVVLSSNQSVDEMFAMDFFRSMMAAVGLGRENVLRATEPMAFRRMLVPAMSFEELSLVHQVFAEQMNVVGRALAIAPTNPARPMLYLSKERLRQGNVTVDNEAALTALLRDRGVTIAFPEELTLKDQVALWFDDPVALGFAGSAFHTSVFCPGRRLIVMGHGPDMWVNQMLLDEANGNRVRYMFDDEGLEAIGAGNGFQMNFRIKQPHMLADELIRVAADASGL